MARQKENMANPCESFEQDLVLFHYGELGGADEERVKTHSASCAACAGYLKELAALLPLTVETDDPPQEFWHDYNRELRQKLEAAEASSSWWQSFAIALRPSRVAALAGAAVVVLALAITLGKVTWTPQNEVQDVEIAAALSENLEFFGAMEVLDNLELLEFMGSDGDNAA
jgi:hypothetical protein